MDLFTAIVFASFAGCAVCMALATRFKKTRGFQSMGYVFAMVLSGAVTVNALAEQQSWWRITVEVAALCALCLLGYSFFRGIHRARIADPV